MPTYDYECDACAHTFEVFQSIQDPLKRKCPACGKKSLRRLIGTGAALLFKGSGFYKTDYRSDSYRKGAAADKGTGAAKSGDNAGGDTKSAAKDKGEGKSEGKSKKKAE